jgi:hypothetical protein
MSSNGLCPATRKAPNRRFPFRCCLDDNHTDDHEAHGPGGIVLKRWPNSEKTNLQKGRR